MEVSFHRSQSAADTVSHPSLLISDDEEPPLLSPQGKIPDKNGNLPLKNNNMQDPDLTKTPSMDAEIKVLLDGTALELMPEAVGQVSLKSTSRSKAAEFSARLMGLPLPETVNRAWTEHPIIKMGREEVNNRFSDMPFGAESEKRLGCPPPAQAAKVQTTAASETLCGVEMSKLPHALRSEIPAGAKIETVELKSKLPRAVEEETSVILWNAVRKVFMFNKNISNLGYVNYMSPNTTNSML